MATMSNDELLEILSWLLAKAIHKLKSSSKLFSELPQTPYFVAKQAENSLKKDRPSCFFIQRDNNLNHNDHVEIVYHQSSNLLPFTHFPYQPLAAARESS
ncbi:hypothetical protein Ahy_B06g084448 isoform B [Arachis hypogaea]|uniref:Uncharacterized protein n=1 Tax=Arachis hypogaea TaxID=3818 RepID=A0A444YRX5_ARAHY|nr:hypothetical protein Ahy_B06g084448 isoform B [Arachis hypogaea]